MFPLRFRVPLIPQESFNLCLVCSGEAEGEEKGDHQEQWFLADCLHQPGGTLALWQKVVERSEPSSIRFQFTIQGSAPLLESPEGASRSEAQTPTRQVDPRGPSQPCFLCFLVVLSASTWQGKMRLIAAWKELADPKTPAWNKHCSALCRPSRCLSPVVPEVPKVCLFLGTSSTVRAINSWPYPALCFHKGCSQMFVRIFLFVCC